METNDIILLIILSIGAIWINWNIIEKDFLKSRKAPLKNGQQIKVEPPIAISAKSTKKKTKKLKPVKIAS